MIKNAKVFKSAPSSLLKPYFSQSFHIEFANTKASAPSTLGRNCKRFTVRYLFFSTELVHLYMSIYSFILVVASSLSGCSLTFGNAINDNVA